MALIFKLLDRQAGRNNLGRRRVCVFREVSCYVGVGVAFGDAARWVHLLPEDRENGEDYRYYIVVTQRRSGRAGKWRLVHVNGRGGEKESLLVPYINQRGREGNNIAYRKGQAVWW